MKNFKIELSEYVNEAVEKHLGDIEISPVIIAAEVVKSLDPNNDVISIISHGFNLQVRVIARSILNKKFDPEIDENQADLFTGLQENYAVKRPLSDGDGNQVENGVYVARGHLTLDERNYIVGRLKSTGMAFIEHAEALEAETQSLIVNGSFKLSA